MSLTPAQQKVVDALKAQYKAGFDELNRRLDEYKGGRSSDAQKIEALEAAVEKVEAEIIKIVGKHSRMIGGGNPDGGSSNIVSFARLLHGDESFAAQLKGGRRMRMDEGDGVKIEGGLSANMNRALRAKNIMSALADANGVPIETVRSPDTIGILTRTPRLRDVIPVAKLPTGDRVEYVKETAWLEVSGRLTIALNGGVDTILPVDSAAGFLPATTIRIGVGTANEEEKTIDSVDYDGNTITLTAAVTNNHNAYSLDTPTEGIVGADEFSFTPQARVKPQATPMWSTDYVDIMTLAHFVAVTRQVLADEGMLEAYLGNRLELGLALNEERQILYGAGTAGRELQGIITDVDTLTYNQSTVAGDSVIDAVRRAMTLIQIGNLPPDGIVMHPTDWQNCMLVKDDQSRYMWVDVQVGGTPVLWALPVIVSTAINQGQALLGSFAMAAQIYDREQASVRASDSHMDFFTKNMVAILAEERIGLARLRPEGMCVVNFDV